MLVQVQRPAPAIGELLRKRIAQGKKADVLQSSTAAARAIAAADGLTKVRPVITAPTLDRLCNADPNFVISEEKLADLCEVLGLPFDSVAIAPDLCSLTSLLPIPADDLILKEAVAALSASDRTRLLAALQQEIT